MVRSLKLIDNLFISSVKYVKRNNLTDSASPSDSKHSSNQDRGEFKSPSVSNPNAHPLASSTIISSSNAPTSPTSKALPAVLPIKHANIKIDVKDASNDSKETTKTSNGSLSVKSDRTVCEQSQSGKENQAQNELNNELMTMFGNLDDDLSHDMKGLKNVLLKLQSLVSFFEVSMATMVPTLLYNL